MSKSNILTGVVGTPTTVAELITVLQQVDPKMPVIVRDTFSDDWYDLEAVNLFTDNVGYHYLEIV